MRNNPKLNCKKNGKGYITSYTVNIGSKEARELGLVNDKRSSSYY